MVNPQYNPQYNKYESQFLDSVASTLKLVDQDASVFKARSSRKFTEKYKTNTQLVKDRDFLKTVNISISKDLMWTYKEAETKLKETLRNCQDKIDENNWKLGDRKIRSWKNLIIFLRNYYFPIWWEENRELIIDRKIWEELWEQVTSFTGITIRAKKISTLEFDGSSWGEQEEKMPTFPWDSELRYEIKSQQPGYLTLIQKYASEKLYLFSPSCLVRQPYQPAQNHQFPSSRLSFLPLKAGIAGVDWVIAIISQKKPSLSWIREENQKPLQLEESNLQELLNFIELEQDCEVIGTKFRIVEPVK